MLGIVVEIVPCGLVKIMLMRRYVIMPADIGMQVEPAHRDRQKRYDSKCQDDFSIQPHSRTIH